MFFLGGGDLSKFVWYGKHLYVVSVFGLGSRATNSGGWCICGSEQYSGWLV